MLQVARSTAEYLNDKRWHLIKMKFWSGATQRSVVSLMVQFMCQDKLTDCTPIKKKVSFEIVDYKKDIHRKSLCKDCVSAVKK